MLPIKGMRIFRVPPVQILHIINRINQQQLAPTQVAALIVGATTSRWRSILVEIQLSLVCFHVSGRTQTNVSQTHTEYAVRNIAV